MMPAYQLRPTSGRILPLQPCPYWPTLPQPVFRVNIRILYRNSYNAMIIACMLLHYTNKYIILMACCSQAKGGGVRNG